MKRGTGKFLRRLQRVRKELASFDVDARDFLRSLPEVSEADLEALTPDADLMGTLECLLGDDLEPAMKKLAELENLLCHGSAPAAEGVVPER